MEDNKENSEIELPEMLKKKKYLFSEEASKQYGYCEATTKDGQTIKYTIVTEKPEECKWSDTVVAGEFSDNEISSLKIFDKEKIFERNTFKK